MCAYLATYQTIEAIWAEMQTRHKTVPTIPPSIAKTSVPSIELR